MTQSCYRHIQEIGLSKLYENDEGSRLLLRSFMGLALLPADQIQPAIELLKKKIRDSPESKQMEIFFSYFKKQWLNSFNPTLWSVNESTWRTNNVAEGI